MEQRTGTADIPEPDTPEPETPDPDTSEPDDPDRWVLVVDAANVVGARADQWWRDRAGAAERLLAELATLAERGLPAEEHPGEPGTADPEADGGPRRWRPEIVVVLEGQARAADDEPHSATLTVVRAVHDGDSCIVEQVRERPDADVLVATSDRELRRRVQEAGARVRGAGWLRAALDDLG